MSGTRIFLLGMLALLFSGCGQIVTETLTVPQTTPSSSCAYTKRVVVMPFADYSYADDIAGTHKRNMAIMEAVTDHLVARGFQLPIQEDVLRYLVDENIIKGLSNESSARTKSLEAELNSNWSSIMKSEISNMIKAENNQGSGSDDENPLNAPGTHGIDRETIARIGADFDAGYILRGRVIEYDLQQEHTWQPMKKGILPFVYGSASRVVFGVAKSEKYDTLDAMALSAGVGAMLGDSATSPYTHADKIDPSGANSLVWGVAGAGVGYLASQGGDTPQAVVELRIWVQDATTGDVIWTNRSEVKVAPQSMFADSNPNALFDTAVSKAVGVLMDDFWTKSERYL